MVAKSLSEEQEDKPKESATVSVISTALDHRVMVTAAPATPLPELWMEVYVEGDVYDQRRFAEMFSRARCQKAASPEVADIVVFGGGSDVFPGLYGEKAHKTSHWDLARDQECAELYQLCLSKGIPMLGICRGAQFLHVMNGGKLWQNLDKHNSGHTAWDTRDKTLLGNISSVHHQACRFNEGMEVLLEAHISLLREAGEPLDSPDFDPDSLEDRGYGRDIEAYFYKETGCFGIQGHPEYAGFNQFTRWSLMKLQQLFIENPDFILEGNFRRLQPEQIAANMAKWSDFVDSKIVELN